ncbi:MULTISPECIES: DNA polymerase III subunit beta [Actinosynnema]|uniref:DNA polymerase III subunit beta n=1 Tax=Actinosynnema TaxID=40566 RepID=UPI0020A563D6|nr:DNA polymerase III subunit beta [Actinosynnema pretiosum]MCP2096966.1 DNA polymerase-3 subunit beta [Actinosynnema pretiosum]
MDLTATTSELASATADIARLLPGRVLDPVLAGVVLRAGAAGVELSGSDRERSLRLSRSATTHSDGAALVPAKPLAETLRALDSPQVRLVVEGSRLAVRTASARFALPLLDLADHPGIPELPPVAGTAPAGAFASALGAVATAASKDDALPVFTGVRVHASGDRVELITSDRYRLGFASVPWEGGELDALAPAAQLAEVAKQAGRDGRVELRADADRLALSWPGGSAGTALLAAPFPDERARKLLAAEGECAVLLEADELAGAVRRAAPYAGAHGAVELAAEDGELRVRGSDPQAGESSESVKASVSGGLLSRSFQIRYLSDALRAFAGRRVELRMQSGLRSTVLAAEEDANGVRLTYLVVPLRTP